MVTELQSFLGSIWSYVVDLISSGWTGPEIARTILAAVGALYTLNVIVRQWRHSGRRLVDRLEEFLSKQEQRLVNTREDISQVVSIPSPSHPIEQPVFHDKALNELLYRMDWGYGQAATDDLDKAVSLCSEKARLSKDQSDEHVKREVLAHLLLGAKFAANESSDPGLRVESRRQALGHFQDALEINPDDPEALEFAGMIYLQLGRADEALNKFNRLIELRTAEGGANLARAYRLQASAYENLAEPSYGNANIALNSALQHIPGDRPSDRAITLEQQALVRIRGLPTMLV